MVHLMSDGDSVLAIKKMFFSTRTMPPGGFWSYMPKSSKEELERSLRPLAWSCSQKEAISWNES